MLIFTLASLWNHIYTFLKHNHTILLIVLFCNGFIFSLDCFSLEVQHLLSLISLVLPYLYQDFLITINTFFIWLHIVAIPNILFDFIFWFSLCKHSHLLFFYLGAHWAITNIIVVNSHNNFNICIIALGQFGDIVSRHIFFFSLLFKWFHNSWLTRPQCIKVTGILLLNWNLS